MKTKTVLTVTAFLQLTLLSIQFTNASPFVVNGESNTALHPATVSLRTDSGSVFCTGTAITPHHVLTAAHCLASLPPEKTIYIEQMAKVHKIHTFSASPFFILPALRLATGQAMCLLPNSKVEKNVCINMNYDFGIVETKTEMAHTAKLTSSTPTTKDQVEFVGYGLQWLDYSRKAVLRNNTGNFEDGAGVRTLGKNTISEVLEHQIKIEAPVEDLRRAMKSVAGMNLSWAGKLLQPAFAKNKSGVSRGDSGGPIYNSNNEVLAVVSYYSLTSEDRMEELKFYEYMHPMLNANELYDSYAIRTDTETFQVSLRAIMTKLRDDHLLEPLLKEI